MVKWRRHIMVEWNRTTMYDRQEKGNITKNQGNKLLEEVGVWSLGNKLAFRSDDVYISMHKLGS